MKDLIKTALTCISEAKEFLIDKKNIAKNLAKALKGEFGSVKVSPTFKNSKNGWTVSVSSKAHGNFTGNLTVGSSMRGQSGPHGGMVNSGQIPITFEIFASKTSDEDDFDWGIIYYSASEDETAAGYPEFGKWSEFRVSSKTPKSKKGGTLPAGFRPF